MRNTAHGQDLHALLGRRWGLQPSGSRLPHGGPPTLLSTYVRPLDARGVPGLERSLGAAAWGVRKSSQCLVRGEEKGLDKNAYATCHGWDLCLSS